MEENKNNILCGVNTFRKKKKGYFPLCQTDWSEISGNTPVKWNNIFRLNWANQKKWLFSFQILLPNSLIRAKNRFVKNGTANFGPNIPTQICGPPPEVIPNILVRRNRKRPFHLNSDQNFRNFWHNGKHPRKTTRKSSCSIIRDSARSNT